MARNTTVDKRQAVTNNKRQQRENIKHIIDQAIDDKIKHHFDHMNGSVTRCEKVFRDV